MAEASARVLVAGLGDLGARVLDRLAADPHVEHLVGCGAASDRATATVSQAALVADALGGPGTVRHVPADLGAADDVRRVLDEVDPDVVVLAASRHSWWRTPPAARHVPYGIWLPLQASLLRTFMRAHRAAGSRARVVALAHPDVAGPLLAAEGLAPDLGAGNVAEVASKLRLLAAARHGVPRGRVDVRLVLHHAAERLAFPVFDSAFPASPEAPYLARVTVDGTPLDGGEVDRLLRSDYPLATGTGSHALTAATVAQAVDALLSPEPRRLHVPAPGGLPGGFPVTVSRSGVTLDLPDDIDLDDAVAVNTRAAASDGIEALDPDGTLHFTAAARDAARSALGVDLDAVRLEELEATADALEAALARV